MSLAELAGWVAPAATMLAAVMTASNLGARVTGWGFMVFAVGSVAWTIVAFLSDQSNLLWTNGFLCLVNLLGIWRWLGRQARYEDGGQTASAESEKRSVPTLAPVASLAGRKLVGPCDAPLGVVVDAMMSCETGQLTYVVISEGGVGGVGERLHALRAADLRFGPDVVATRLTGEALGKLPDLRAGAWPTSPHDWRLMTVPRTAGTSAPPAD